MIAITGATGQLGRLVISQLSREVAAADIVAIARDRGKAGDIAAAGVEVREADYGDRASLEGALRGVDTLLLISSNAIGERVVQHRNAVEAARAAGVGLIVYTSVLRADTSELSLAEEHRATEALIRDSGLAYIFLRNGWYTENYAAAVGSALAHGALFGAAGQGRIASASRLDYAEAAARALTGALPVNRAYELAGDTAYTLAEFAAEIGRQASKAIGYTDLAESEYEKLLVGAGLPAGLASLLASSDASAGRGALFDDSGELRRIIGRPTTPWTEAIQEALAAG